MENRRVHELWMALSGRIHPHQVPVFGYRPAIASRARESCCVSSQHVFIGYGVRCPSTIRCWPNIWTARYPGTRSVAKRVTFAGAQIAG